MATTRELFHNLFNKYNLLTIGCGATRDIVEDCLKEEAIPQTLKEKLTEVLKSLEKLENASLEANQITNEIHESIYKIIDPDTGKLNNKATDV